MKKQNGIVANWNEEKGFGFIDPQAGDRMIFAHISDYSKGHQKPFKGLEVQYLLSTYRSKGPQTCCRGKFFDGGQ